MISIQKGSDTAIIVVHEIYGINQHMKYVCQSLSEFDFDVSLKSGHGERRDYNKLNYNRFEVSNHEKENI
jgi:dienelactone hydrolase